MEQVRRILSKIVGVTERFLNMRKYNSKNFRKEQFFLLYDFDDNFICYFDCFDELYRVLKKKIQNLVQLFNETNDNYICVVISHSKYKLYTFTDKCLELV